MGLKKIFIITIMVFAGILHLIGQPVESQNSSQIVIDIPSYKLYQNLWDHYNIAYYKLNNDDIPDTLILDVFPDKQGTFVFPVPTSNKVISRFGKRGSRYHSGTDIKIANGDTIVAAFDGKVRISSWFYGYGNLVAIRHNNGLETLYGHLSKVFVNKNDWVKAGTPIALGGRTGRASTDHLHFETRILGVPVNSEVYINFDRMGLNGNVLYFEKQKRSLRCKMYDRENFLYDIPFLPTISNIKVLIRQQLF